MTMRCPQCARTVEQGAHFCACGYPVFWDERAGRPHTLAGEEQEDLSRVPDEQTVPPPPRHAVQRADPAPPTEQLVPLLDCPDCHAANPVTRTLCQRCGAPLLSIEPDPPPPRRRPVVPVPVLVGAVLALTAAAVWSLGVGRDAGAGEEPVDGAAPLELTTTAAPSAAPSPTPSGAATVTHVVQQGESLTTIAQRYGTTVAALAQANGIADPDLIALGQELLIPAQDPSPDPTPGPTPGQR